MDCISVGKGESKLRNITPEIKSLLEAIEGTSLSKRLIDTPERVQRAYEELFDGYNIDIPGLFKSFDDEAKDQLVYVKNVPFNSFCEHHFLQFYGEVSIAYLPDKCAIGASKLPRLVYAFSHRLQLQERIAEQIAESIMAYLKPRGVAVIIEGKHSCISCRGIKSDCKFGNSIMLGEFRKNASLRAEILSLIKS